MPDLSMKPDYDISALNRLPLHFWPEVGRMEDGKAWYCEIDDSRNTTRSGPVLRVLSPSPRQAVKDAVGIILGDLEVPCGGCGAIVHV